MGKKKKKASRAVRTPKKPISVKFALDGESILCQIQEFAREFQKRIGSITDG